MGKKIDFALLVLFGLVSLNMIGQCLAAESDNFEQTKQNIFSTIDTGDYAKAELAISKLSSDFSGRQNLPETLYWLAVRYEWSGRDQEAKQVYNQIIKIDPNNIWANKAKLGISRTDAISLISAQNYVGAEQAINKMMSDFSEHPDLAEALYWIVPRYEWQNKYDEAKNLCQQIVEKYPSSTYLSKAKIGVSRAEVMSLIISGNYEQAQEVLNKMIVDFAGNPDLPEALCLIAERYEWINKFTEAKDIYLQVAQKYPDDSNASKAKLGASMADVRFLIVAQDHNGAEKVLDKVVADFAGHPDLPKLTILAGEQFYKDGLSMESKGLGSQAKDRFERAVKVWDGFISRYPESALLPEACCWAGDCYRKLGKYEESIQRFQIVADEHPQYKYAWHAQFTIGSTCQQMKDAGLLSESDADLQTKTAYQQVISKWPGCGAAENAQTWLNEHNSK